MEKKKAVKSKVVAKKWQVELMPKIFINGIIWDGATQIYLNCHYKFFVINLPSRPFLGQHFGFYNFFHRLYFTWGHIFLIAGQFLSEQYYTWIMLKKIFISKNVIQLSSRFCA